MLPTFSAMIGTGQGPIVAARYAAPLGYHIDKRKSCAWYETR